MNDSPPAAPRPRPASRLAGVGAYRVPRPLAPVDLYLDGNEGAAPPPALLDALVAGPPADTRLAGIVADLAGAPKDFHSQ